MERDSMFVDRKTQCCQLSFLLSLIYKFNAIPIKAQQVTHTDTSSVNKDRFMASCSMRVPFISFPSLTALAGLPGRCQKGE